VPIDKLQYIYSKSMEALGAELFTATLALIGVVIIIAALLSGLIERSGLPQVAVFLALGALLGPAGLSLLDVRLESPILRVVGTLSLVLVLFTDALSVDIKDTRKHGRLAFLTLGPGTIFSGIVMVIAAKYLLQLTWPASVILGAALASTDPVMLRGLLRRPDLPSPSRHALRLESGLNDVVLLPVVLIAMAFAGEKEFSNRDWASLILNLFLLGPAAGIAVGLVSVSVMDLVRRKIGIRRDYESLYSLGVAFAAYAAAEALHGSGFLAAFAAGLVISMLDVELCDCFLEYGQTTAEMALLFTFVLFGTSLIWTGLTMISVTSLLFVAAVLLARPLTFVPLLSGTQLSRYARFIIAWFGPRGLSSLLLILLPVFSGVAGSENLFSICCLVVLFSIVIHGGSLMVLGKKNPESKEPLPSKVVVTPSGVTMPSVHVGQIVPVSQTRTDLDQSEGSITIQEMLQLQKSGEPVLILDVRSERSYEDSDLHATGAIRIHPDLAVKRIKEMEVNKSSWLIAFCA
jgi:NhaP-type Na+/H+ or K+/H+ antiporter